MRIDKNNPNKYAVFINAYVESFKVFDKEYKSQDEKWLISSLKNMRFVEYIDNIEQINWRK